MTASAHSSVPTKFLSIDHTFSIFSFFISLLLLTIVTREVYSEKSIKMFLFTCPNPKLNINIAKTILPRQ